MGIIKYRIYLYFLLLLSGMCSAHHQEDKLNQATKTFAKWLNSTGLSQPSKGWNFTVTNIIDSRNAEYYSNIAAWGINKKKCKRKSNKCPRYLVKTTFKHPEKSLGNVPKAWEALNRKALLTSGISLDERIVFKLSHILSVPVDEVQVEYDAGCYSSHIRFLQNEIKIVGGLSCSMASDHTVITKGLSNEFTQSIDMSSKEQIDAIQIKGTDISRFIHKYFLGRGASLTEISNEDNYVSFAISSIKNEVIPTENLWESIQLSFFIGNLCGATSLRVIIDGQYAAGLGEPSPYAYIDMEPVHSKALQEYAGSMIVALKKHLAN